MYQYYLCWFTFQSDHKNKYQQRCGKLRHTFTNYGLPI